MPATKIRDDGRIERMITLAYLLSTRSEIHIDELQERLMVDKSTIENDLNVLMFCGLPPYSPEQLFDIIIEDDYVSMLYNDVFVKPLRLSRSEVAHTIVALERLLSNEEENREPIKEIIDLLSDGSSSPIVIEPDNDTFIKIVIEAIEKNRPVDIEYLSLNSASIRTRTIDPIRIFTTASISYIFGYCHESKSLRIFRSDRITAAKINETKDQIYNGLDESNVDISSDSPYVFVGDKDDYVDLEISPKHDWILDTYPHEVIEAGKIYRFYTSSPFFIARMLLSYSPEVRYVSGTLSSATILNAVEIIINRMQK